MSLKGKNSAVTLLGLYISLYNTILQLKLDCHKMGKWTEVPCAQAFLALYQTLLCAAPVLGEPHSTPDILDNLF